MVAMVITKKDDRQEDRQERIDRRRQWKKEKPRPLADLLNALSKVLMWGAILAIVLKVIFKLF